jgi:hypothetical protein
MSTESAQIEERQHILEMVAAGKLSVTDAAEMIAALGSGGAAPAMVEAPAKEPAPPQAPRPAEAPESHKRNGNGHKARWLHIEVNDMASGKSKVRVNLPLTFLNLGLKLGGRFAPELQDLNLTELTEAVGAVEKGILVDVADEEGGEHVQIYVD